MTTIVPKGAGRPAAKAKSDKHAQRTPLPARPGVLEQARVDVAEINTERYGVMTVAELRSAAKAKGVEGYSRMKKGDLLNALLEAERATVAVAAKAEVNAARTDAAVRAESAPADEIDAAFTASAPKFGDHLSEAGQKSFAKASAFAAEALLLGWEAERSETQDPAHWAVTVARGGEKIDIEWMGGVFQGDTCYYSHPVRTPLKLRNASHAKKVMTVPPATADEEARKVSNNKAARPRRVSAGEATTEAPRAPLFTAEISDEEVLKRVSGRNITWINSVSGASEEAHVAGKISIKGSPTGRSLSFTSITGFRSARVESIVAVR